MAMVVQHNLQAMNANRMLSVTSGLQSKSTEKLSSGYKINRAADDAAGLSISEKMRKQMRGLNRASDNAQDGISAVQTAEGALTEVHSMLQRMNELAVQSANGTNSKTDREAIQSEVDQLKSEINRVSETTKFNETYLLKGGKETASVGVQRKDNTSASYIFDKTTKKAITNLDDAFKVDFNTNEIKVRSEYDGNIVKGKDGVIGDIGERKVAGGAVTLKDGIIAYAKDSKGNLTEITKENISKFIVADQPDDQSVKAANDAYGTAYKFVQADAGAAAATDVKGVQAKALSLALHVGADSTIENKINVKIATMDSETLGIKDIDMSTEDGATNSIDSIKTAIQRVSNQRSSLGAVQNRLEHTINNLDNVAENTTAAESRIRDTDMAEEMVNYSKNNILAQAGQSMLAQANQANQGVLSLLG